MHPLQSQRNFRIREALLESTLNDACRWAEKRRMQQFDGDLAPFSAYKYPYTRGIYNSPGRYNYIMKGAQMGLTELAVNIALYVLVKLQKNTMYVLPTGEAVDEFSKARVAVAIKQSAYLLSRIDSSIRIHQCGAFTLYMRGAKKDHNLKSVPVNSMILDEVDEIREHAIQLALERLSGQDDPYLLMLSTPTYPGMGIDGKMGETTRNHYFFKCPGCSRTIELLYPESFVLCGMSASDPDTRKSTWICTECKRPIGDVEKIDVFNQTGIWIPTNKAADTDFQGWEIHQGYSPKITGYRFGVSVHNSRLSVDAAREFANSKRAVAFAEDGAQLTDKDINKAIGNHSTQDPPRLLPNEIRILGNDPGNPNYWVVCAYRFDSTLEGDINERTQARLLAYGWAAEDDAWTELAKMGRDWGVHYAAMDIGGDPRGSRAFARRFRGSAMPVRYVTGRPARDIAVLDEDGDCPVANVDKHAWMQATYSRLFGGRMALPLDITPQFREHLKAQVRRTFVTDKGVRVREYVRPEGKADHWMHAMNYCEIGLKLFETHGKGMQRDESIK